MESEEKAEHEIVNLDQLDLTLNMDAENLTVGKSTDDDSTANDLKEHNTSTVIEEEKIVPNKNTEIKDSEIRTVSAVMEKNKDGKMDVDDTVSNEISEESSKPENLDNDEDDDIPLKLLAGVPTMVAKSVNEENMNESTEKLDNICNKEESNGNSTISIHKQIDSNVDDISNNPICNDAKELDVPTLEKRNDAQPAIDDEDSNPVLTPIGIRDEAEEEEEELAGKEADSDPDPDQSSVIELFDDEEEMQMDVDNDIEDEKKLENNDINMDETDEKNDIKEDSDADEKVVFHDKECINFECKQNDENFTKAPMFILNFYKIQKKSNKNQFVCEECYDKAVLKYKDLRRVLVEHKPLVAEDIPKRQDFVEIIDSDEEDSSGENDHTEQPLESADISLIEIELEDIIRNTLNRVKIDQQLMWTRSIYMDKLRKMEDNTREISACLSSLQKKADTMHNSLYQCPKTIKKDLPPFDLNTMRPYIKESPISIPPAGELIYPKLEIDGSYYAVKNKPVGNWMQCKLLEIVNLVVSNQNSNIYKVKFTRIKIPGVKCVPGKHIAYGDTPKVRLKIGTRIIAVFDGAILSNPAEKNLYSNNAFYPGIIAEELQSYNRYRYLIFFDDGYSQYVRHKDVRVVCHCSENVWEDVHPMSRDFICAFLKQDPMNRPMVQVRRGQSITTESNGRWLHAKVMEVDASLVKLYFEEEKRYEWMYLGSTRLGPLFKETTTRRTAQIPNISRKGEPFVRYTQNNSNFRRSDLQNDDDRNMPRAVARKTTSKVSLSAPGLPVVKHMNNSIIFLEDDTRPKGKVVYYTAKKSLVPKKFVPHDCKPTCLSPVQHNLNSYSPLAKPLLSGWERLLYKAKLKKYVTYRAPCGRQFRSIEEIHKYLRLTKNKLNVENFDFDPVIHCLAEYVIETSLVHKDDLSDGVENMVIPCVNYYDLSMPPECIYSTKRIPTEGVNLNLDPAFLAGCDCEDDCTDKSKCSCWQLTLGGAKYGNANTPLENVGYHFKKLPEAVPTGIYECNSRCKCKSSCINRVVQQPLQMKLQVFKTSNRGWGLRCLNDVPKGSFICIYAGHLLTEQKANEGGANSGDEYFAELDYIEVAERLKEGYESDVQEDNSDDDMEEAIPENDSDEEFRSSASINKNASINTRLRARRGTKDFPELKSPGNEEEGANTEKDANTKPRKSGPDDTEDDDSILYSERKAISFVPNATMDGGDGSPQKYKSIRSYFGKNEYCYIMDAKIMGNVGRYFNHSCSPNLFVQNVFVDTQDLRFPWVAFFALSNIRAGTELTWNYNYEVGVVPGKVLFCQCGAPTCRGRLL